MALKVYKYSNYLESAEREEFRILCKLLSKNKEDYILIANPIVEGRELDALLFKRDAIIVLEFKNYGGSLSAVEFGEWHIINKEGADVIVKGGFGGKNPFNQVNRNKWSVTNKFKGLNLSSVNAYHVAGLVIFNQKITIETSDFSSKVNTWFRIADVTNAIEKIEDITSKEVYFDDELWNALPRQFKVEDYLWTEYESQIESSSVNETLYTQPEKNKNGEQDISINNEQEIETIIRATGFKISHKETEAKRNAENVAYTDLNLSERSLTFLQNKGIPTLWKHQHTAIQKAKEGKNICVTTSTSSGKTEIFQISAIETLKKDPEAKILAIYPMKALNRQQVERWKKTGFEVGKIDGDVTYSHRSTILQKSRIVVMTPDVMHTFLLGNLNNKNTGEVICDFIKNTTLLIIDELHLFKGVFGTNSAYLFRRFNHIRSLLRKDKSFAQYITASATLPNACEHSFNITGVPGFVEIGIEQDASPISEKTFYYVEPDPEAGDKDLVIDLVYNFTEVDNAKSITFVEGRQRAGELANKADDLISDNAEASGIYPYRAGYEQETVDIITEKLHNGNFKGVVSTSALEIGIDIDGLNIAVIADMPHDKNSYQQRIGRVGRFGCRKSYVIIVRNNSFASKLLFDEFGYNIDMVLPNYEPALYLEDCNVQNVHALCHVGDHEKCEYLQWKKGYTQDSKFDGTDFFPPTFIKLCRDVLAGQYSRKYSDISCRADNNSHHAYTLRFWGKQYTFEAAQSERGYIPQEQISREQIGTEGYIGAVRTTMLGNTPIRERVCGIDFKEKVIFVTREYNNYLSTSPVKRKYIVPNFNKDYRFKTVYYGDEVKVFNLRIIENYTIYGYYEHKNKKKIYNQYKKNDKPNPLQLSPLFTTGTVIFHPSFNNAGIQITHIAEILFETFLRRNAFDRNDINFIGGHLFTGNEVLDRGDKFIAIYDANNILNITGKIANNTLLKDMFKFLFKHKNVIAQTVCPDINDTSLLVIDALCQSILENEADGSDTDPGREKVFKFYTEVLYYPNKTISEASESESNQFELGEGVICTFGGTGNMPNTYNLILNGKPLCNIPIDLIEPTENTEFEPRQYDHF